MWRSGRVLVTRSLRRGWRSLRVMRRGPQAFLWTRLARHAPRASHEGPSAPSYEGVSRARVGSVERTASEEVHRFARTSPIYSRGGGPVERPAMPFRDLRTGLGSPHPTTLLICRCPRACAGRLAPRTPGTRRPPHQTASAKHPEHAHGRRHQPENRQKRLGPTLEDRDIYVLAGVGLQIRDEGTQAFGSRIQAHVQRLIDRKSAKRAFSALDAT